MSFLWASLLLLACVLLGAVVIVMAGGSSRGDKPADVGSCLTIMVDGQPARVQWSGEMTAEDVEALEDLVRAVRRRFDSGPTNP
jgi:hypothetical protein